MEDQLLDLVVNYEIKELENKKKSVLKKMYQNKKTLKEYKQSFLTEIISCSKPLIDDSQLSIKLENIKSKIDSCFTELKSSIHSKSKIDESRDIYRSISRKGALFYINLFGFKSIDPLYQFSIDSFVKLFINSIGSAKKDDILLNRISNIIDQLTNDVFEFSCISIYEKHNMLFLFQMACTLDKDTGNLSDTEMMFFIKGNVGFEKINIKNPTTWLSNECWQDVVSLSTSFSHFSNLIEHVYSNVEDWKEVGKLCLLYICMYI